MSSRVGGRGSADQLTQQCIGSRNKQFLLVGLND